MADQRVRPLPGSSFVSFEDAVLQAIESGSSGSPSNTPARFNVQQFAVEVGGFVGRPRFTVVVVREAGPNV